MKPKLPPLNPPSGATAAIYFVDEQLAFEQVVERGTSLKYISPAAARSAFAGQPIDSGWLPVGVQRCGQSHRGAWMVRWHPPAIYTIRFDGPKARFKVPMPALVFFGRGSHYYLWAMQGKTLNPTARLFRAPVANVNGSGLICFGRNAHPAVPGGFEACWKLFWSAPFNDDHSQGKHPKHQGSINPFLIELSRKRATTYPASQLVRSEYTLESAIERLTDSGEEFDDYEAD